MGFQNWWAWNGTVKKKNLLLWLFFCIWASMFVDISMPGFYLPSSCSLSMKTKCAIIIVIIVTKMIFETVFKNVWFYLILGLPMTLNNSGFYPFLVLSIIVFVMEVSVSLFIFLSLIKLVNVSCMYVIYISFLNCVRFV